MRAATFSGVKAELFGDSLPRRRGTETVDCARSPAAVIARRIRSE
jgi:hypothetical protein